MTFLKASILLATVSVLVDRQYVLAAVSDRRAATWNLQGSSASTESKWSNNVRQLLTGPDAAAVLALQEAGTPVNTAKRQGPLGNRLIDPQDLHQPVFEYIWNLGSKTRPDNKYIYFTQNDRGANRVNIALVTSQRPDHVIILRPPGNYDSVRPILGVQFGKDNYFSIHASASGGGDAASIVNVIANYFASRQQYDHQFMIMGDFNRIPKDLKSSLEREHPDVAKHVGIFAPTQPTHNSGKVLDYTVIGQYSYDLPHHVTVRAVKTSLSGQLVSDHKPVRFFVTRH